MTIDTAAAAAIADIEATHAARETALSTSRALTRQCANTIRAVHRAEFSQAQALLHEAGRIATDLRIHLANHPNLLFAGYNQDALKE